MPKTLFMLAIMPDEQTREILEDVRQAFAEKYACRAALKPPVHITLIPPFSAAADETEQISSLLSGPIAEHAAFPVVLRNYSTFPRNKVVFVDVVAGPELVHLQQAIETLMHTAFSAEIKRQPVYHPHFTIGRKDIPRALYPEAAKEYGAKTFEGTFLCEQVTLLRHDGHRWQRHAEYYLKPS